ncbi:glycoside hydrolase family protein [Thetidibacter halocola]|uniref:Lysozyme n=1 Tax=Thetidibacter halocola TaxID=2827239 RepID=A0A8J7WEN4_9RHOB|nr:D-Ala-D-Ala carboxypeptidase family metallohydrolase [Thetidibacter halocola]MBS0124994.1 DUF882 domain-containing protein [Thetidibacter halocola]
MQNRFLDRKAYLSGLSPTTARSRASSLAKTASRGGSLPAITQRNRFGFAVPMAATDRALVVLMENGGIDLQIGSFVDGLLRGIPGGNLLPNAAIDPLVSYVEQRVRQATDALLESAEMVLNRYSAAAPDPYGQVVALRNGTALYNQLKDTLVRLTEANKIVDLMVLTHGNSSGIVLEGGQFVSAGMISELRTVHNGGRPLRLRAVYQMNCVGSALNQAWIDAGAKVVVGSARNNFIPEPMTHFFFRNWKNGQSFTDAVTDAYQRTIDTIESVITSGLRTVVPGAALIPGFDTLVERLADIANRQFILDSRPLITGDGTLTITSDSLSFSQSQRVRSFSIVAMGHRNDRLLLPGAMEAPERIMTHQISDRGVDFIKAHEGFRGELYNDPVGHCTVGYGHLLHRGNCDGRASEQPYTDGISAAQATELLRSDLHQFERAVNEAVTVRLNQHQFDALVSFTFNVGIGRSTAPGREGTGFLGSTLLRRLNAGEYDAVPSELARWNKASGRVLPGLTRRRAAEGRMFTSGDYSTGQSFGRSMGDDPIAEAAYEIEGNERPDLATNASVARGFGVSNVPVMAHCPVNAADTASTAHFTLSEFESRDGADTPRGVVGNLQLVMEQLEVLRSALGDKAITITSGYRSPAHNTAVGGAEHSQHLCGRAADIRVADTTPVQVHAKIEELIAAGRMRQGGLGLYDSFVHYDTRGTRARWDNRSAQSQSLGVDEIAAAAHEVETGERPDIGLPAHAMSGPIAAHCPVNTATTASSAHFTLAEFASRDGAATPTGTIGNIQVVMNQLEILRAELGGKAITIVSGYRSPAHNSAVGGATRSQHLCGRAADIRVEDHTPQQVHAKIEELIGSGRMQQGGLGLYSSFVHYDTRGTRARWTG